MKKQRKLIAFGIAVLLLLGLGAGCAQKETASVPAQDATNGSIDETIAEYPETTLDIPPKAFGEPTDDGGNMDLSLEMVPLAASPAMFTLEMPSAPGTLTKANNKATIDYSNSAKGYIMVKYASSTTKELRVLVTGPSGVQYQYSLKKNATYDTYPLSDGNGKYSIGVYEQVEGSKYATAISATIEVKLENEFAPFLFPNQYVNFTDKSAVVAKAADLVKNAKNLTEKISSVYTYVISNLTYDKELAANVKSGYLPDVDAVMARGKGICFDYAAVMTAMLRSQGIPTRLVIGYAGTVYHAWIDVYSETEGWINNVIFFDGESWKLMDPTFASTGNQSASIMQYIGTGSNYSARFIY